jgi:isoquinoline 1-oxidoreductase beta subunit
MASATASDGLARRSFMLAASAASGVLALGWVPTDAAAAKPGQDFKPDQFIRIDRDSVVTLVVPFAEMGQGVLTGIAMLVAEELEVAPETIRLELAPGDDKLYGHPVFGDQITGGSASIRGGWASMRRAGAAARTMLVAAAAKRWAVEASSCQAENGFVVHAASNRRLPYGALVETAQLQPVPQDPPLRTKGLKVIGKPLRRLDTPAKVNGAAKFGFDVAIPGMQHAAVMRCPIIGGSLKQVDDRPALAVKGVKSVVRLKDAVVVVAEHGGAARKGLAALAPDWAGETTLTTADLVAQFDAALEREGVNAEQRGDAAAARQKATKQFEAVYRLPMLAHAAMEPLCCTVSITKGKCEVWVGSQTPGHARKAAAEASGLPIENVTVHNHLIGGAFGRRLEHDWVGQAVEIATHVDGPLKVIWSREEDMRQDAFRYHNHSLVRVGLDDAGMPISWEHRIAAPGVMFRFLPAFTKNGVDLDAVGESGSQYAIPNLRIDYIRQEPPEGLLVGNWRGVGTTRNAVIVEGVIDDLALQAKRDPVDYRRAMLEPGRLRGVLDRVAKDAGWGSKLPASRARGIAISPGFGSFIGMVAEVEKTRDGKFRVERLFCAIDTGHIVNPTLVRQQIEGGIVYGLSALFYGRITIDQGRIQETNFHDYRVLRMNEMPEIEIALIESEEEPGGVGEPGTAILAPAILNAIRAAGGPRVRDLPLSPELFSSARSY